MRSPLPTKVSKMGWTKLRGGSSMSMVFQDGTDECQKVFQDLKAYLTAAPLLSPTILVEELYLYLVVSPHAMSSTLIREERKI